MKIDKLDLLKKGWSVGEIQDASKIITEAEARKHVGIEFLEKSTYWTLLFLLIMGNVIFSIFLVPFIFVLKTFLMVPVVALMGLVIGLIYSLLIKEINKIEMHGNTNMLSVLFLSGIINSGLIVNFSIEFSNRTGLIFKQSPYIISLIYFIAFIAPHIVSSKKL